jgi:elongation factor G
LKFVDAIRGGVVPREYILRLKKAFTKAVAIWRLAGYPASGRLEGLRFGSYHDVDSNEMAQNGCHLWLQEGCRKITSDFGADDGC